MPSPDQVRLRGLHRVLSGTAIAGVIGGVRIADDEDYLLVLAGVLALDLAMAGKADKDEGDG